MTKAGGAARKDLGRGVDVCGELTTAVRVGRALAGRIVEVTAAMIERGRANREAAPRRSRLERVGAIHERLGLCE